MNKVFLIGNLTRDPELQTTKSGAKVCKFSIAVQRTYNSRDGKREVDFLNVVAWGPQGENCAKYLKKGSKTAIVGSIQTSSYTAQDGTKRNATDIKADEVQFLAAKFEGNKDDAEFDELSPIDEDLPF